MRKPVDHVLQKLISDQAFRETFYRAPIAALRNIPVPLSPADIMALLSIPPIYFGEFARGLPSNLPMDVGPKWQGVAIRRQH